LASFSRTLPALLVATTLAFHAAPAAAEEAKWDPAWPKFSKAEMAFTGGMGLSALAAVFLYHTPTRNWDGGILFDDAVRSGLRLHTREARLATASVSDGIYYGLLAFPLLVDLPLAGLVHKNGELVVQMLAMDLESFAVGGVLAMSFEKVGRARPMLEECERDPGYDKKCGNGPNLSSGFLSGHTAIAFTGAGLICAHHTHLPLYGGGAPDMAMCIAGLAAAFTQGTFRITSDNHYASDVLLGAGVGLASGWLLPSLLHYRKNGGGGASLLPSVRSRDGQAFGVLAPTASPQSVGASFTGVF
jgi:membrane-associated phospholipid phosphatase